MVTRVRRPGVLERVGQRLLHDPVRRDVDARRQLDRLALDHDLDWQPRRTGARDELVEPPQARRRRERQLRLVVAQQPQRTAHLAERLLARVLDHVERAPCLVDVVVEHPPAPARLQHNEADRVGDDVVQLAGDPRALLGDGLLRNGRRARSRARARCDAGRSVRQPTAHRTGPRRTRCR
jgi:hypothetical protein